MIYGFGIKIESGTVGMGFSRGFGAELTLRSRGLGFFG